MRKIFTLTMAFAMAICLSACGSSDSPAATEAKAETVIIQSLNAGGEPVDVEVPYDPQRIAVLDMAALDILDALGVGDRVVGSAKVSIPYLADYNPENANSQIIHLGTVKTADLEKVAACAPDIIFIGGRLSSAYADLEKIAPVVHLAVDYEKGIVESTKSNVRTIAAIFGSDDRVDGMFTAFQPRIDALKAVLKGQNVLLGMYNANALGLMGTASQLNIIVRELGANNLSDTVGEAQKATHGEEASWETIVALNPAYMFILDRSTATEAAGQGDMGIREVIENELIRELDVYKNNRIVYFTKHANVWYTSTGGIQALDTILSDLEGALGEELAQRETA